MAVLTTAEHRAVDFAAGYLDHSVLNICVFVEEDALVALAGTEEVAGDGVSVNLGQRARHAYRAAGHLDCRCTVHIGGLVTAIDVGQDMAATDGHVRVTLHPSCAHNVSAFTQINAPAALSRFPAWIFIQIITSCVSIRVVWCAARWIVIPAGTFQVIIYRTRT